MFFIPGTSRYVSFPMPYGYNAFHHLGVQGGAIMSGKSPVAGILDAIRVAADAFNPIGNGSLMAMVSPTIADPWMELLVNENFAGSPIYRRTTRSIGRRTGCDNRSARRTLRSIDCRDRQQNLGRHSVEAGFADFHPDSYEHLWGYFVGGLGRFVTGVEQTGANAAVGEFEPKVVPWVKSFYGSIDEQSQRTEYFRKREKVLAVEGYLKTYQERGDSAAVKRYVDANQTELAAVGAFKTAEKIRKQINKERRSIDGRTDMTTAQRTAANEALDKREIEAMKMARTAYVKASKSD